MSLGRLILGVGSLAIAFVVCEVRFGYALGVSRDACAAVGGKHASTLNRCITRACFWFGDCGTWASPGIYREQLAIGDPVSKVVFWLGNPDRVEKAVYLWPVGKGEAGEFRVTFQDGRVVQIDK